MIGTGLGDSAVAAGSLAGNLYAPKPPQPKKPGQGQPGQVLSKAQMAPRGAGKGPSPLAGEGITTGEAAGAGELAEAAPLLVAAL